MKSKKQNAAMGGSSRLNASNPKIGFKSQEKNSRTGAAKGGIHEIQKQTLKKKSAN